MSNKTSLIITSTDTSGKTSNKTLTDINPATSSASLKSFAEGLIGLTDNTYDGAAIVERTEVVDDAEKVPAHAQFTINGRVYTEADAVLKDSFLQLDVTFNASDETYVKTNGDDRTLSVPNPKSDLTKTQLTSQAFYNAAKAALIGDKTGAKMTGWKSAKIFESTTVYLDLATA